MHLFFLLFSDFGLIPVDSLIHYDIAIQSNSPVSESLGLFYELLAQPPASASVYLGKRAWTLGQTLEMMEMGFRELALKHSKEYAYIIIKSFIY